MAILKKWQKKQKRQKELAKTKNGNKWQKTTKRAKIIGKNKKWQF